MKAIRVIQYETDDEYRLLEVMQGSLQSDRLYEWRGITVLPSRIIKEDEDPATFYLIATAII